MFQKFLAGVMSAAMVFSSVGCATTGEDAESNKAMIGALLGALVGGMAGSQVGSGSGRSAAIAAGMMAGAAIGHNVGARLNEADRLKHQQALRQAVNGPSGAPVAWQSASANANGRIVPLSSTVNAGRQCRQVNESITIDNRTEQVNRTYCNESDGSISLLN